MSHLNISFADRGMMPSSLFRDSESISISKSWLPSMGCVLPDPVCPYAMMHTYNLFSEHTISLIIISVLRFTRHQVLVSMTGQQTIAISNSPRTRPNNFGFARYWWSSSCSLLSCYKTGESKAVPWERRLDYQPLFGKWPHAPLPKGRN